MLLEYLSEKTTLDSLTNELKGLEVDTPEEEDYDPLLWQEIRHKRFISTCEKIKGHDALWQLTFNRGLLYLIQLNIEFGSKSENSYNRCMDLCKSVLKINNSQRDMYSRLTGSYVRPYNEFKSETGSDSGIPEGYYIEFARYSWKTPDITASLNAGCIWPDSMSVEYREEHKHV